MRISVIIPLYNGEKTIGRCLDSIYDGLNITETDALDCFEVVIVDDGSKDNGKTVIDRYIKKYKNIKYIRQNNAGVSAARNRGIEESIGYYVCFMDADDYLTRGVFNIFLKLAGQNIYDAISYDYKFIKDSDIIDSELMSGMDVRPVELSTADYLIKISLCSGPCQFLVKRDIILKYNIQFNKNIKYWEDQVFIEEMYAHVETVLYLNYPAYNYVQYRESAIHTIQKKRNTKEFVESVLKVIEATKNNSESNLYKGNSELNVIMRDKINYYGLMCIMTLVKIHMSDEELRSYIRRLKDMKILNLGPFPLLGPWKPKDNLVNRILYKIISYPSGILLIKRMINLLSKKG